jgi:hypothetical protein
MPYPKAHRIALCSKNIGFVFPNLTFRAVRPGSAPTLGAFRRALASSPCSCPCPPVALLRVTSACPDNRCRGESLWFNPCRLLVIRVFFVLARHLVRHSFSDGGAFVSICHAPTLTHNKINNTDNYFECLSESFQGRLPLPRIRDRGETWEVNPCQEFASAGGAGERPRNFTNQEMIETGSNIRNAVIPWTMRVRFFEN